MTKLAIQQQVLLFTELLSVGSVIPAQIFSFFYEWKIVQLRGFFCQLLPDRLNLIHTESTLKYDPAK